MDKNHKAILLAWFMMGCRWDTMQSVYDSNIQIFLDRIEIVFLKDKIAAAVGRKVNIRCNCCPVHKEEFCFFHNPELKWPSFPLDRKEVPKILKQYGLTAHSCRRGLAVALAWHIVRERKAYRKADVYAVFGWLMGSDQFENYAGDFGLF